MDLDTIGVLLFVKTLFGAGHVLLVGILFAASFVTLARRVPGAVPEEPG